MGSIKVKSMFPHDAVVLILTESQPFLDALRALQRCKTCLLPIQHLPIPMEHSIPHCGSKYHKRPLDFFEAVGYGTPVRKRCVDDLEDSRHEVELSQVWKMYKSQS